MREFCSLERIYQLYVIYRAEVEAEAEEKEVGVVYTFSSFLWITL